MPSRMVHKLEQLASKHNVSFTDLVLQCLEYALDHMDEDVEEA